MKDNRRAVRVRIGRTVRKLRLLRNLTQERLAERSGSTSKHISLVELGKVNVTIDALVAIAAGLSVDVAELVEQEARNVYSITTGQLLQIEDALRSVERVRQAGRRRARARRN